MSKYDSKFVIVLIYKLKFPTHAVNVKGTYMHVHRKAGRAVCMCLRARL